MSLRSLFTSLFSDTHSAAPAPTPQPPPAMGAVPAPRPMPSVRPARVPSAKQQAVAADFAYLHTLARSVALSATPDTTWGLGRDKMRRKYTQRGLRLMLRLAQQIPPSRNQAETLIALQAKVNLLNQLLPVDWSLNMTQATIHPVNGTLSLTLIRHVVHINAGGAWQIQERFSPCRVLLERPSIRGGKFRAP